MKDNDKNIDDVLIGVTTTENIKQYGEAAAEFIKGYKGELSKDGDIIKKGLKQISESKVHKDYEYQNLKQQAGFSAEVHYTNKTNAENIINKNSFRISRSNDVGLGNHTQFDVLAIDLDGNPITTNETPIWSAQMKFCGKYETDEQIRKSSENLVKNLTSEKWDRYRGNKVLVPSEQSEIAREYAKSESDKFFKQSEKFKLQGDFEKAKELEDKGQKYLQASKDIVDSQISSKEAMFLRTNPKLATAKYVAETSHKAGIENAKASVMMSTIISTSRNVVNVMRGEKDIENAVSDTVKETLVSTGSAYVIGASDTAIRGFMAASSKDAIVNLSKGSLPATIATIGVQTTKSLIRYANGEIDSIELVGELGEKGTGMLAASWGAAIGTAVMPGIGTIAGGMIGYMTSSTLYNSCMQVLKQEKLSYENRQKIHALSEEAIKTIRLQRKELEEYIERYNLRRKQTFETALKNIDLSINSGNLDMFTQSLNNIAIEMGTILQFKNFDDFNSFMLDDSLSLEF